MERMGLVSHVEREVERMLSLGQLPPDGLLPSENSLARLFGVSRATAREALLRLSVRGLVVQHPGRRSRAVALDEALTLENLEVALHTQGPMHPERRRLLEGFLSLKRDTAVEVLATCCERASKEDLALLGDACFALRDAARWEQDPTRWAQAEFTLLRLAARVADNPGHALLLQSLERAFWGMADKLAVLLEAEQVAQWALCAMHALAERHAPRLRADLSALLKKADERLLHRLAPSREPTVAPALTPWPAQPRPECTWAPGPPEGEVSGEECTNLSDNQTGSSQAGAGGGSSAEPAWLDANRPEGPGLTRHGRSPGGQPEQEGDTASPMPQALADAPERSGGGASDGLAALFPNDGKRWRVLATHSPPRGPRQALPREDLELLAQKHSGEDDGSETALPD
jgi:GntR family transcriptional regulator, transcriptional repressor for pyruvate dehydrogenase complex